ncbi:PREDICTED: uncharacterized protein LOC104022893 [Nipponia nippon]|nr:PREDICTED: uncharacterized protein LOC104022893 [Nipponia nippon]
MLAGFGPGKVSACVPSCSVQLPQRNAGLPRALARDGVRTSSEKKTPSQRLALNSVGAMAESDKANHCLTIIQFRFFSLTSIQILFEPATFLNIALSIWRALERDTYLHEQYWHYVLPTREAPRGSLPLPVAHADCRHRWLPAKQRVAVASDADRGQGSQMTAECPGELCRKPPQPAAAWQVTAGAVWSVSLLLTLPMMLMVTLTEGGKAEGKVKRMCAPTWSMDAYRTYLTVLFSTSIMAPGIIIGFLYTRLARTYLESQRNPPHKEKSKRSPRQKVLIMIFSIVLVFWACFLPFWIWQLVRLYSSSLQLTTQTQKCINYLVTCLTYSNSCINPFLYTLLTKNYREYLRNRHRNFYRFSSSFRKRGSNLQCSWGRSMSSSNQYDYSLEALGMATLKDK